MAEDEQTKEPVEAPQPAPQMNMEEITKTIKALQDKLAGLEGTIKTKDEQLAQYEKKVAENLATIETQRQVITKNDELGAFHTATAEKIDPYKTQLHQAYEVGCKTVAKKFRVPKYNQESVNNMIIKHEPEWPSTYDED